MKIELESLEISALRDFDVNQKIDLPQSGVISVIGTNKDDGGSNGTGKSTFSMSPVVNMFGPTEVGISSKSLKNRHLSSPVRVGAVYKVNDVPLAIDRTIGGKLRYKHGNAEWKEGKSEDIQEEIANIIKLTPEQFKVLSSKAQGEYGGFLLMKDSEKKEFLSSFFDLKFIDDAKERAQLELSKKEQDLEVTKRTTEIVRANYSSISADLAQRQETYDRQFANFDQHIEARRKEAEVPLQYLESIDTLIGDPTKLSEFISGQESVKSAAAQLAKIASESKDEVLASLAANKKQLEELTILDQNSVTVPKELTDKKFNIEQTLNHNKVIKSEMLRLELKLATLSSQIAEKQAQFDGAGKTTCPSCRGILSQDAICTIQDRISDEIKELTRIQGLAQTSMVIHASTVYEDEEALNKELDAVKSLITEFLAANNKDSIKSKLMAARQGISSAEMALKSHDQSRRMAETALKDSIESSKFILTTQKRELEMQISRINGQIDQLIKDKNNAYEVINSIRKALSREYEKLEQMENMIVNRAEDIDTLLRICQITSRAGFVGYIFDGILEDLNSEINHNLKIIPNARKFSLQFTPDKVAKTTGTVSKSITYQLYSGTEEIEFNTLSGGEKLSVIIAVDEALDTVLSRRLGVNVGWKFLDEQFSWIDENSKEAILEFYKIKSDKKAYFIVDHASEFNASLDQRIVIVKENNIARFKNADVLS